MRVFSAVEEKVMNIFKVALTSLIVLMAMFPVAYGADSCSAGDDNSSTFSTASDIYSPGSRTLATGNHHQYYFDILTAGTLTVTVTSPGSKVKVAYSDNACPSATTADPTTRIVTVTDPTDINVDLYTDSTRDYTMIVTFVPSPLGMMKTNTPLQTAINTDTNVTYTLSVTNYSSNPLTDVEVTDTLPSQVNIGSEDNISFDPASWNCSLSTKTVNCSLIGSLDANSTAPAITIATTANVATAMNVVNTATATADGGWNASDDSTLAVVSATQTVDLEIQKFASNNVIPPNTNFAYLIFVVNYSNPLAQLVRVTDTFPAEANVSFISAGGNGWNCTAPDANRQFTCDYDQPLGKGITYFLVNARTGDSNGTLNVRNWAEVTALNPISHDHDTTDYADINISTEASGGGTSFTGFYTQGGNIEVSDLVITNRANAEIWTKVASTQDTTFPVYFVDPTTGAVMDYNGTNQNVPLTVIFKLTDETCSAANETYLSYDPAKSVIARFDAGVGSMVQAKTEPDTTFDLRNIAKRNSRLIMKYVDINAKLDYSGESCSNSNLSANIKGLPQCIANSVGGSFDNNKYINVFGIAAFVRCAINNGQPCSPNNGGVGDEPYNTEYGCYECTVGGSGYCSKDNFAIRPKTFDLNITDYASYPIVKAEAISLAFKGLTNHNTILDQTTLDYNETQNTTFAVDINITDATKICQEMNLTISPAVGFGDGLDLDTFRFSNIGDVNLTIHDINGSEFAIVDMPDENHTTVSRFITPYTAQFRIIPHHFTIDGNITNGSNGFTYLSNFEEYNTTESRMISASLDVNVTAMRDDEVTMTNYAATCYAQDGNLTVNLANALSPSPAGSLSRLLWYDVNHADDDHNGSVDLALGLTAYPFDLLADQYDNNESNGTAQVNYVLNFDRNQTKVVDPFDLNVTTVDADDIDLVHGESALNSPIIYVYGRLMPRDVRVFGTASNAVASAWYELYNAATKLGIQLPPSRNESGWFINTRHDDVNVYMDGDGYVRHWQIGGAPAVLKSPAVGTGVVNGVENYDFGPLALGGYKAHIHLLVDSPTTSAPWLWYGVNALKYADPAVGNTEADCFTHPCFNITVVPAIGATGSQQSGGEVDKTGKKSESGGTWKSSKDYAPAVR